ncbi:MAG: twin-arginine translocation signal domain-containing protein, partial [Gemmatimonadales bacterium]
MPTRRQFLEASSLAVAGAAATPLMAQGRPREEQAPGNLPPAIAALQSQEARMRPITTEERRGRIARARELMGHLDMDALMLMGGTSLRYFTDISWGGGERTFAVLIPREGTPFLVCPAFERDRAMEQVAAGPLKADTEIMTWQEDDSPYRLIADGLRGRGVATG